MRHRLVTLGGALALVVILSFVLLEDRLPAAWRDPGAWQVTPSWGVAMGSIALLATDVLLPVPSSVVMVGNGVAFGFAGGALVSTVGATSAVMLGWLLGRVGGRQVHRWLGPAEGTRLAELVRRHGAWVVVASRPVPVVAEMVAVLAGAGGMRAGVALASGFAGATGTAVPYAWAGAAAAQGQGWWPLLLAAVLAALTWFFGRSAVGRRPMSTGPVSDERTRA